MQAGKSKVYKPTARIVPEGTKRKTVKGGEHKVNNYTDTTKTWQYKHFQDTGKLDATRPIPRTRGTSTPPPTKRGNAPGSIGNKVNFGKSNGGSVPAHSGKPRIEGTDLQKAALRKLRGSGTQRAV